MALPVGTQRLGLQNVEASTKSVVLVKLTDSALGAIAQFLRQRSQSTQSANFKPTIQFLQNTGTISIPIGEDGHHAKFSFALTSTDDINGPQGSFECLQTTRAGCLDSLGPIQEKIQVHAAEDTYQRFGEKMVEVKKENEKRSTVFIDRQGAAGGLVGSATTTQKIVRKSVNNSSQNKFPTTHRDRGPTVSRFAPGTGPNPAVSRHNHMHQPSSNPSDVLSGNHPMLDRFPSIKSSSYQKMAQQVSEVIKRPMRERIVHLLAVRPYKKPELLSRIVRDGVREKDKHSITLILKQVSAMKDNTYHLLRHIWNDVSEDWPFYTEEERQAFRRRKPQNLTPPGSDGSTGSSISSGHSSSSSHPASPQPPSTLKRGPSLGSNERFFDSASTANLSGPVPKKTRVSNYMRPPDAGKSPLLVQSPSHSNLRSPSQHARSPLNESNGRAVMDSNEGKVNGWLMSRSSPSAHKFSSGSLITPASSPDSQDSSNADLPTAPPDMEIDQRNAKDYLIQFTSIADSDQRRLYKAEFNKNYALYRKYHNYLEGVSKKFAQLENKLRQQQEGSDTWKQLKMTIFDEYNASKKDSNYTRTRQEFQYLHDKLAHIKTLVHQYDTKTLSNSEVS